MLATYRAKRPGTACAVRPVRASPDTSKMATMDPEPIPTEPTTDSEPPDATSLVTGPSLASESPAAGRGRGSMVRRAAIGLALVLTFSVGIGVGRLALPALGGAGTTTPTPTSGADRTSASSAKPGTSSTRSTSAPTQLNDKALIYGAINGMTEAVGDTGHTSFMTPEERAARSNDLSGKYVGIGVRIDTAEDGLPLIVGVFKGSPAEKARAGQVGDEIVAVDGKTTTGQTIDDDRQLGPRRGRHDRSRSRSAPARPARRARSRMVRADVAVDPVSLDARARARRPR